MSSIAVGTAFEDRSDVADLPGDAIVERRQVWILDPQGGQPVRVHAQANGETLLMDNALYLLRSEFEWGVDASQLYVQMTNGQCRKWLLMKVDVSTGQAQPLAEETLKTFYPSLGPTGPGSEISNDGRQLIWRSERDGWAHLYYMHPDVGSSRQLESGQYEAAGISRVDWKSRQVYFNTYGKNFDNPYILQLQRVSFDGGAIETLTPEPGFHETTWAPQANVFLDQYSFIGRPPVVWLRSGETGKILLTLSQADDTARRATGWRPGEVFTAKARDGKTLVWGVMNKPSSFSPEKSYPVIVSIYSGGTFRSMDYYHGWGARQEEAEAAALAELGFIVIGVNGFGTLARGQTFRDVKFGHWGDRGLADHVSALKDLAKRFPWFDTAHVGIFGHSAGGAAAVQAILRYPEVFKVAAASAGEHDPRLWTAEWEARSFGLFWREGADEENEASFSAEANTTLARNLKGKLLLVSGTLDFLHASTLRLAYELIRANKDFDMITIPEGLHAWSAYGRRRMWDYFVRNLMGAEPPHEYRPSSQLQWNGLDQ